MVKSIIGSQFPKIVINLISESKKTIDICVFDWRWYFSEPGNAVQLFNQALIFAARRGVVIRAVTSIQETVNILSNNGIKAKRPHTDKLIHPKLMIFDDCSIVIGSHNYSQSAFSTNYEASVLIDPCDCVSDFKQFFNNLFNHG